MGQLYDDEVKGQNLSRMKRIEDELNQLKNLINEQILGSSTTNCDGNADGNAGDSSKIDDGSYCLVDTLKIENDLITITNEDIDYQEEFNKDRLNQNRPSNEDELILGGVNFEISSKEAHIPEGQYQDKVIINQVAHSLGFVDLKPADLDSIQMSNENENLEQNLELGVKNDKKINHQDLIVQMDVRCKNGSRILHSNRTIDQESQDKNERNQKNHGKIVENSSKRPKGSIKKSHICSYCSKSFSILSNLMRHIKIHTGERSFKCKICSKSFSRFDTFKRHHVVHTGEKPYSCSICSKSFSYNHTRNDHILRIHKGEKTYSCSVCDKAFSTSDGLKKHWKRAHDGEKSTNVTDFQV